MPDFDALQALHDLEHYLGRDLDQKTGDDVIDYVNDDPMDTSPRYLAELFNLTISSFKPSPISEERAEGVL